jgi:Protein of unknown function (DUF3592).
MVNIKLGGGKAEEKPASVRSKIGASLFFFIFFAMGSLFTVFLVRDFAVKLAARTWQKTACVILESSVTEDRNNDNPYAFTVRYRYEYGGQTYFSTCYRLQYSGSDDYAKTSELTYKYPVDASAFCFVNPSNPSQAILEHDSLLVFLFIFLPLVFVVIGAGGIYFIWRGHGRI